MFKPKLDILLASVISKINTKPDVLFEAVLNEDTPLVLEILKTQKDKVDREKAYNCAIDNNLLRIAYVIRRSFTIT